MVTISWQQCHGDDCHGGDLRGLPGYDTVAMIRAFARGEMPMAGWIILGVLVVIGFLLIGMYNSLVQLRVRCDWLGPTLTCS